MAFQAIVKGRGVIDISYPDITFRVVVKAVIGEILSGIAIIAAMTNQAVFIT
jgi:hypothetical protein